MTEPRETSIAELVRRYDTLLLDAYGVLVNNSGALPGAAELLGWLRDTGKPHLLVTNDASRLPETIAHRFDGFGLPIEPAQVVTSGSLLAGYFGEHGLRGARCLVLGPEDSAEYVRAAGGVPVEIRPDQQCDAVIVCDEAGFPYLETVDATLSVLYRQLDRGAAIELVMPNPDLVYPKNETDFGFTSGAIALLLEAALAQRYPDRGLCFRRLGKPHRPIFAEARRRARTESVVMIGDQLGTDIAGARGAGIDSALLTTGLTRWDEVRPEDTALPTYLLPSIAV